MCARVRACARDAVELGWAACVRRATTYDWEMTPSHGVQNFTNLAFGGSLDAIDWAYGNYSIPGVWDFNGQQGGCQVSSVRVRLWLCVAVAVCVCLRVSVYLGG